MDKVQGYISVEAIPRWHRREGKLSKEEKLDLIQVTRPGQSDVTRESMPEPTELVSHRGIDERLRKMHS
jgi:hypothetical protein